MSLCIAHIRLLSGDAMFYRTRSNAMNLPDEVETKLRGREAIVLPRVTSVKKGQMIIHYHCDGKAIGETTFTYTPETYADWFRSMADRVSKAQKTVRQVL